LDWQRTERDHDEQSGSDEVITSVRRHRRQKFPAAATTSSDAAASDETSSRQVTAVHFFQTMSASVREAWRASDCVCFDVDSTVITEEGIDVLAAHCGCGESVAEWTKRYALIVS
jgi:hypothetical protein